MTQTLSRELKSKFIEIISREAIFCSDGLELESPYKERIEAFAEQLADAAIEVKNKPKIDLKNSDPAWAILAGEDIDTAVNIVSKEAKDNFEREMHFNPLPWGSSKEWEKLEKFVVNEYIKDNEIWKKYHTWRKAEGQYKGAMTNPKIYAKPSEFMAASFPAFLAYTAMYQEDTRPEYKKVEHVETETKAVPNPYRLQKDAEGRLRRVS